MTTFNSLRAANNARQQEWDPNGTMFWRVNELGGEIGETQNLLKKIHRERNGIPGSRATREQLAEELADIVICVDLLLLSAKLNPVPVNRLVKGMKIGETPDEWGCNLMFYGGVIAALVVVREADVVDTSTALTARCAALISCVETIATWEGIDLEACVIEKFNATSEKMNLKTRMSQGYPK